MYVAWPPAPGPAAYRGSWTALAPAAAFVAAIDVYQVRFEETALRERFGDVYDAYSRRFPVARRTFAARCR
jgi:protein-S-isoprenylcysteine O-methyltransferase Ste14